MLLTSFVTIGTLFLAKPELNGWKFVLKFEPIKITWNPNIEKLGIWPCDPNYNSKVKAVRAEFTVIVLTKTLKSPLDGAVPWKEIKAELLFVYM